MSRGVSALPSDPRGGRVTVPAASQTVVCSWCLAIITIGAEDSGPVSHGCCRECWPAVRIVNGLPPAPYPEPPCS